MVNDNLQALVLHLSSRFASLLYRDLDRGIDEALADLGTLTGVDRAYVFVIRGQITTNTHEWCAPGVSPEKENLQAVPLSVIQAWLDPFARGEAVMIPRVRDLPPERQTEREVLEAQGIQSLIAVPMSGVQGVFGFVGFDSVRHERAWQAEDVVLLQATANLIAGALQRKAAAEARDAVRDRLHKLAALVPGMLYQFQRYPDGRSRFPYASDGIEQIYGLPASAVVDDATPVMEVLHPDDLPAILASVERSFAELSRWELEYRVRHRDGQVHWLHGQATPEAQVDGSVLWHGYITDITERKAMQEALMRSEANLRALFENTEDALILFDREYRLLAFNREAASRIERVLGVTAEVGLDVHTVFAEHDAEILKDLARAMAGETVRAERLTTRLDGSRYWVAVSISPVRDDGGQVVAIAYRSTDITDRKAMEEALRLSEARLKQVMEALPDAVAMVDAEGQITFVNSATETVLGYPPKALLGRSFLSIVHPDELPRVLDEVNRARGLARRQSLTYRALHADGRELWLETSGVPITDGAGQITGAVFSSRDVTERHRAEQALKREVALRQELLKITNSLLDDELGEGFYQRLLERALALVPGAQAGSLLMCDDDGFYRFKAAVGFDLERLKVLSLRESELGRRDITTPGLVYYNRDNRDLPAEKQRVFEEGGRIADIKVTLSIPILLGGKPSGFFNLDNFEHDKAFGPEAIDIAQALAVQAAIALQRLRLEAQLKAERDRYEHLAGHDALTGLPNRMLFQDRLEQALARARRREAIVGLVFLDLDGFKEVNDTLGHDAGDELLRVLATRLAGTLRAEDTLARLGGDEFAVILSELAHVEDAEQVVKKLLDTLEEPLALRGQTVKVSGSFGISLYPIDATSPGELLKYADIALYRVKGEGKRGYAFFKPELDAHVTKRLQVVGALREALDIDQLSLHYQPWVDLATGHIQGLEAFARWRHPELGEVPPESFIRLAEEHELIHSLGGRLLELACRDFAAWAAAGLTDGLRLAVNVSPLQLRDHVFITHLQSVLSRFALPPTSLLLEITESALAKLSDMLPQIEAIRALGVRLVLDDSGVGSSFFERLAALPISTLKIDRSFVERLTGSEHDRFAAVIRTMISLGEGLGIPVIAEGVEEAAQRDALLKLGCRYSQGFLFGRPLPAKEVGRLLARGVTF